MRMVLNGTRHISRAGGFLAAGAGLAVFAAVLWAPAAADEPQGLPPASWPTSPHRGVIDGWGRKIPCRCRFNGKAYQLGEIVCMRTHVGTVLTRCDIFENNTSWIPSQQPCQPDAGT